MIKHYKKNKILEKINNLADSR